MATSTSVTVSDISVAADNLDPLHAAAIYKEHGCLVVRGLMKPHLDAVRSDIEASIADAYAVMDEAVRSDVGWSGKEGTLFIPAPEHFGRDKQIMVLGFKYHNSAAFFRSALDNQLLDVVEGVLGPDIELFMDGQCLVKEPVGGHPKNLHQDGAYFEHKHEGPVAVLTYAVDTDLNNGALHVVPGSHKLGMLDHVDTESHLGLDPQDWPWERSVPVLGEAGDSIFFHVKTIHGSKPNYSDGPRPVFIHRYRRPDDFSINNAATAEKRKANAAHPPAQKGAKGIMVRGRRKLEHL